MVCGKKIGRKRDGDGELLTESGECNEPGYHEDRMQVELLLGTVGPGKAAAVEDDPEECQDQNANQEDRGQDNDDQVLKPGAAVPGVLQVIVVTSVNINNRNLHFIKIKTSSRYINSIG